MMKVKEIPADKQNIGVKACVVNARQHLNIAKSLLTVDINRAFVFLDLAIEEYGKSLFIAEAKPKSGVIRINEEVFRGRNAHKIKVEKAYGQVKGLQQVETKSSAFSQTGSSANDNNFELTDNGQPLQPTHLQTQDSLDIRFKILYIDWDSELQDWYNPNSMIELAPGEVANMIEKLEEQLDNYREEQL